MSEDPGYEVQASRRKLLRALLTGRPMQCAGPEVVIRRRPSPEAAAQARWGMDHIANVYGDSGMAASAPAASGGGGASPAPLAAWERELLEHQAAMERAGVGHGRIGIDPAAPRCPACLCSGGGEHGGGCPNTGLDPSQWRGLQG
jgi:hypothetical protein